MFQHEEKRYKLDTDKEGRRRQEEDRKEAQLRNDDRQFELQITRRFTEAGS